MSHFFTFLKYVSLKNVVVPMTCKVLHIEESLTARSDYFFKKVGQTRPLFVFFVLFT